MGSLGLIGGLAGTRVLAVSKGYETEPWGVSGQPVFINVAAEIETVFLMPSEGHQFLSSSLIKEAGSLGADISSFAPEMVTEAFRAKLAQEGKNR